MGAMPDDMPECDVSGLDGIPIANALKDAGLVGSTSEGIRMIKQGAVRLMAKGRRSASGDAVGSEFVCQVGSENRPDPCAVQNYLA